jgi:hypothetical protein
VKLSHLSEMPMDLAACLPWRCAWLALLVILAPASVGCATWDWRGKDFGDREGHWARSLRPPADEKSLSGVDARAQEIERNLGVR